MVKDMHYHDLEKAKRRERWITKKRLKEENKMLWEIFAKNRPFGLGAGEHAIIISYAGNEPCSQELRFCLSIHDWNLFERTQLYRDLMEYLEHLETQCKGLHHHKE